MNSVNEAIKFTMEFSDKEITFIDILIKRGNSRIWIVLYHKYTDTQRCLSHSKTSPEHCLKNILLVIPRRICTIIHFTQTKITLFIFVSSGVIRENKSFLIVEPCSRVTCCVEIKLQYFFRKYIFICTIYTLLMQLISAILYDTR